MHFQKEVHDLRSDPFLIMDSLVVHSRTQRLQTFEVLREILLHQF